MAALAAPAPAKELRVATLAPDGSAWMTILDRGASAVAEATGGRVVFKYFWGGAQGDDRDAVRKLRRGELDGAALTAVGLGLIYPGVRVLELPFMFESEAEIDYVRGKMWPYFQDKFRERGFYLMVPGDIGWTYLYTRKPLRSRDDLGDMKLWAWRDDAVVTAMYRAVGVNGVPLPLPDVLAALGDGRIDGCYGAPLGAVALQWHKSVSHATSMPVAYGFAGMVVRVEAWDEVAEADRATADRLHDRMSRDLIARVRRDNELALAAMVESGIEIVTTPATLANDFENRAHKVWDQLVDRVYTREELDLVLRYRSEYRAARKGGGAPAKK